MLRLAVVVGVMSGLATMALGQASKPADIDWNYARTLLDKSNHNEKLTADEQAYLDYAKRARAEMIREGKRPPEPGAASRPAATQGATSTGLIPLDQMTAEQKYKGEDGGLYGGGKNDPPEALAKAAEAALAKVQPLDAAGKPDAKGKVVLMSMGMSNTTQEFSVFKTLADKDAAKSASLVIVDAAQGGKDAICWSEKGNSKPVWDEALRRLKAAGVTPEQVQVLWVKHARIQPEKYGEFPEHAKELQGHIASSLDIARKTFPNLQVIHLSSRIYAGYASTRLNPEPYAYEGAFAVRWVIQDQLKAADGIKGPVVLWGPYLWADGLTPRKSDGLIWERKDLGPDGTHPSPESGREKVAKLLLNFVKTNPMAKGWLCDEKP